MLEQVTIEQIKNKEEGNDTKKNLTLIGKRRQFMIKLIDIK